MVEEKQKKFEEERKKREELFKEGKQVVYTLSKSFSFTLCIFLVINREKAYLFS